MCEFFKCQIIRNDFTVNIMRKYMLICIELLAGSIAKMRVGEKGNIRIPSNQVSVMCLYKISFVYKIFARMNYIYIILHF